MSGRRERLPATISIDSGVVLAYLLGEKHIGDLVRSEVLTRERGGVSCSGPAMAELFCILCRRRGEKFALETVDLLLRTGYINVASSGRLDIEAGRFKCERSVSLADCYVFALAKILGGAAVFARREEDVRREMMVDGKFGVDVIFLEDFARS